MNAVAARLAALVALSPDARLLAAVAGWVVAAAGAVVVPVLEPAVLVLGLALVAVVVSDALQVLARADLKMRRSTPARLEVGREVDFAIEVDNPSGATITADIVDELPVDLRVSDLSSGPVGGMATMVLADFGADVVKVERPGGDPLRSLPSAPMWLIIRVMSLWRRPAPAFSA